MKFHQRMFIGILLIFVDINIEFFDVFPDFLGYIFLIYGFSKVTVKYAKVGLFTSIIGLSISVFSMFNPYDSIALLGDTSYMYNFQLELLMIVSSAILIILYGSIFAVSNELKPLESKTLPTLLLSVLIVGELFMVMGPIASEKLLFGLFMPYILLSFILTIAFLVFLKRRSSEVKEYLSAQSTQQMMVVPLEERSEATNED